MGADERRKHPRHPMDAPLILLQRAPEWPSAGRREGAQLRDVSLGGLAFETSTPLETGTHFEFALYVPTRGWVDGTGLVCWRKRSEMGWLCGASITVQRWDQEQLLSKWLHPSSTGLLRFFFPNKGER